jgi:MFS family permease
MPAAGAPGRRRRRVILLICSLSLFMTYVDSTILNVALPTIARQFHVGVADLQWVADAYLLVLSSFIMLVGSIADRIGRRRVFMTGLLLFSAGSLLCSVSPSVQLLIVFRMLQAIGGCMLTPVSLSILRQVFTDPAERARALGVWSAFPASAGARSSG